MIYHVETGRGYPTEWRDPAVIRADLTTCGRGIAEAHERYAALEVARDLIRRHTDDEATHDAFESLLDGAKNTLSEIDTYAERIAALEREMRDTLCLLQRM